MTAQPDILCIGSVLWDIIGRTERPMKEGYDVPGRITRLPGGVAWNIAMSLASFGMRSGILTAIGTDREGDSLVAACADLGVDTSHATRTPDLPTDRYMAIESEGRMIAAMADAASLEAAGARILTPLRDGSLGDVDRPWRGHIALDGNLTEPLLHEIAGDPAFHQADLRVAPASPGKATRLRALFLREGVTLYVNRHEAELLCKAPFPDAFTAAGALVEIGAWRAVVTDGGAGVADADATSLHRATPPSVSVRRVTGAGDTFMAGHIVAEHRGAARDQALEQALQVTARYISADTS